MTAESASTFAIVISGGTLIWQLIQFFVSRSSDAKNRQFEAYHRLIRELVQPTDGPATMIDRQIAVVFELRRFKFYGEVTTRILTGLQNEWRDKGKLDLRLDQELELTLNWLAGKR